MGKKWNMIVDVSRCDNCRNCFLATKDEHIGNDFSDYAAAQAPSGHRWVDIRKKERGSWPIIESSYFPVMCNHCDNAPCMHAAKGGAVRKRDDGIVIIDPVKSKGQRQVVDACPYGAVFWNEEKSIPQAWIFDAHLLDQGWKKTRMEQVCPLNVLESMKVEDAEMRDIAKTQGLEVLQPELGTNPRVYYKNLHLITTCFVAGSVSVEVDGVEECAEGVEVILTQNGTEIAQTFTDTFGEFKIDRLDKHNGGYELALRLGQTSNTMMKFDLSEDSLYLGLLKLPEQQQKTSV